MLTDYACNLRLLSPEHRFTSDRTVQRLKLRHAVVDEALLCDDTRNNSRICSEIQLYPAAAKNDSMLATPPSDIRCSLPAPVPVPCGRHHRARK